MATADELLAGVSTVDRTLVIDNSFRTIKIPATVPVLGVATDDDVLRLEFRMPRYISNTDLSTYSIRVNYINANGDSDAYTVTDAVISNQYITFTWLVGPIATMYKGNTKFNVSLTKLTSDKLYVDSKFNTAPATLPVLEGLEVDESVVTQYSDIIEQWRQELFGIGDTEEAKIKAASESEQEAIANRGAEVLATIPEDYQTAVSMTDNAARTKADAIICSTQGEMIGVSDSSDDYIRGLRVFGKTTQMSTTGKNLLKTTPSAMTNQGGIITINSDGTIVLSGTFTANASFAIGTFSGNGELIISTGVSSASINNSYLYFMLDGDKSNGWYGVDSKFTDDGTARTVNLVVIKGSYTNAVLRPMVRLATISDDTYEPYSGGLMSPRPDWPQELNNIDEPSVCIYGKNLLNNTKGDITIAGVTYTVNDDGSITIDGTATAASYYTMDFQNPIPVKNTKLIASCVGSDGKTSLTVGYFKADGSIVNSIAYAEGHEYEFVYPDEAVSTRSFITVNTGTICNNLRVYPMVRLAGCDDEYDKYQALQNIDLTGYTLSAIPVTSNGNYTDADGQQWICDEIDFERGVYIQRCKTETLTFEAEVNDYGTRYVCYGVSVTPHQLCTVCMCPQLTYSPDVGLIGPYTHNGIRITPAYRGGTVVARWGDQVIESLTVTYLRATPIETPLTTDEIEWFRFAYTNFPNTTVINDAGATMELKYNADTTTFLRNCGKPTDEQVQAAVDAWLSAHYVAAEGVKF